MTAIDSQSRFEAATIGIDRDVFFRTMLSSLAATIEDVIGEEDARGFVSVVGHRVGKMVNDLYCDDLGRAVLSLEQAVAVVLDLKRRIGGAFEVVEFDEDKVVFVNSRCPFGQIVQRNKSLCAMTSNVFGYVVAESHGYCRVEMPETIATGQTGCRVVVHLRPAPDGEGEEYFRTSVA